MHKYRNDFFQSVSQKNMIHNIAVAGIAQTMVALARVVFKSAKIQKLIPHI